MSSPNDLVGYVIQPEDFQVLTRIKKTLLDGVRALTVEQRRCLGSEMHVHLDRTTALYVKDLKS